MRLPKKFCKVCMKITTNRSGYCDACTNRYEQSQYNTNSELYDYKWSQFSKQFLEKNPICVMCGAPATVTDHKIPADVMKEVWGGNIYEEQYYQPLCVSCNTKKGIKEDKEIRKEWEQKKKEMDTLGVSSRNILGRN